METLVIAADVVLTRGIEAAETDFALATWIVFWSTKMCVHI